MSGAKQSKQLNKESIFPELVALIIGLLAAAISVKLSPKMKKTLLQPLKDTITN